MTGDDFPPNPPIRWQGLIHAMQVAEDEFDRVQDAGGGLEEAERVALAVFDLLMEDWPVPSQEIRLVPPPPPDDE